jgi:hypothetical protein
LQRADGTETTKSTGSRDAKRAKIICDAWQQAEYEAAGKDLTQTACLESSMKRWSVSGMHQSSACLSSSG